MLFPKEIVNFHWVDREQTATLQVYMSHGLKRKIIWKEVGAHLEDKNWEREPTFMDQSSFDTCTFLVKLTKKRRQKEKEKAKRKGLSTLPEDNNHTFAPYLAFNSAFPPV